MTARGLKGVEAELRRACDYKIKVRGFAPIDFFLLLNLYNEFDKLRHSMVN